MPLYLDVHNRVDGLTTELLTDAHKKASLCKASTA
jgi:hypothetical protein